MAKRETTGGSDGEFDVHGTVSGRASTDKPSVEEQPKRAAKPVSAEDRLRRALRNMLDNTAPDATPRPVRQEAEAAVKGVKEN